MLRIPGKIPIIIHPFFWIIALILGWINTFSLVGMLIWLVVIFVSLMVHEFGHALTAVAFGQKAHIELMALGGLTFHDGKKLKLWQDFIVVLMGPLAGFVLFGITFFIRGAISPASVYLYYMFTVFVYVNLFWSIVNLLPVMPLDGGQLLRIIMESIFGFRGLKITLIIGIVLGVLLGLFFFLSGAFLIGAIFLLLAFESFASWKYFRHMEPQDKSESLQELFRSANQAELSGDNGRAVELYESIKNKAHKGLIFVQASEKLGFLYHQANQMQQAYEALKPIKNQISIEARVLLHRLAYDLGDYALTEELGSKCFQDIRSYQIACLNALACANLSKARAAVGWLECALHEGMPTLEGVLHRKDFDPIREDPIFRQFLKNYDAI